VADPCELLPWDTRHFGFPVARLTAPAPGAGELDAALAWCRARGVRCLYFLCDTAWVESARLARARAFDAVDVRITLARRLEPSGTPGRAAPPGLPGLVVRRGTEDDLGPLARLATGSFHLARFYADPRFPRGAADRLYRRWAERDLRAPEALLLVADLDGRPVGFASGAREGDGAARWGLLAVEAAARRRGVGTALVEGVERGLARQGASRCLVATQGRNQASLRLFERCGFRRAAVHVWFHRWFDARREA
jgi:GNAT superfamily N-acetyltransferase